MGMFGKGIVATPQQQAWSEEMARRLGLPAQDQAAVDQYAAMPPQQEPAQGGGGWGQKLGDFGTRLMAAQAAINGDFGTSAQLNASVGAEQRSLAQQAAKAQAERAEWLWRQQWERSNPRPVNNDTSNDYEYIRGILGEDAAKNFLRNKTDPTVSIPLPGGQTYVGPRSSIPGGQVPTAPVGKLSPITGGGAGNGVGGFPRR